MQTKQIINHNEYNYSYSYLKNGRIFDGQQLHTHIYKYYCYICLHDIIEQRAH